MSLETKFTDQEIQQVKELRDTVNQIVYQFGEIDLETTLMQERLQELQTIRTKLYNEYREMRDKEKNLVDSLNTKYGAGQLDIESGVFTPMT
jgi:hypothetical protein